MSEGRPIHPEIGLPMYDSNEVIWNRGNIKRLSLMASSRVVRYARVAHEGATDLLEFLKNGEDLLTKCAQISGAKTVNPTYGIAVPPANWRYEPEVNSGNGTNLLPPGTALVAEVDIIKSQRRLTPLEAARVDGGVSAINSSQSPEIIWGDAGVEQFTSGIGPHSANRLVYLLDIEPHFYPQT